jgi:UDP-N-acetylmuramoyl-L-alanyl-D-glutamate--2,6-diaminopimelate ligase
VKLSILLKALESFRVCRPETRSGGHPAGDDDVRRFGDPEIRSLHYRAQSVRPGGLFVAIAGKAADGHDFIEEALERGAAAIITEKEFYPPRSSGSNRQASRPNGHAADDGTLSDAVIIRTADSRKALADISARFYGEPSGHLVLIGVTGTNGKTTTAYLIESILQKAGCSVGVIGTINYRYGDKTFDNPITTPESLDLQRILAEMLNAGITHVVMEASSHAIDLYRIQNCWFDVGVFTNLSQDHLDFHGDMNSYWSSKKRFFSEYLSTGPKKDRAVAVINCGNAGGRELADLLDLQVVKTGATKDCMIRATAVHCDLNGIRAKVSTPAGDFDFKSALVGKHNLENILSAGGVGSALNLPPDFIRAGLEAVARIPGRLERIENNTGRFVYVDYAHTPDALENVIGTLHAITTQRIICVFGCGGDRDKEKRPLMGEIVARGCDLAVVTSDNPRTEPPERIIDQILDGVKRVNSLRYTPSEVLNRFKKKGYVVEPERRRAIELGIKVSRPEDAVLIAGKGHETYQIIGKTRTAFDDREEARKAFSKLEI